MPASSPTIVQIGALPSVARSRATLAWPVGLASVPEMIASASTFPGEGRS